MKKEAINLKKRQKEYEGVYGRVWREEMEGENDLIIILKIKEIPEKN